MKKNSKSSQSETKKRSSDSISELEDLFENQLQSIYWAEKELVRAFPDLIKNASDSELVDALESHLSETKEHVYRLEEVFDAIEVPAAPKKNEAIAGLISEVEQIISNTTKGDIRDVGIIAVVQKIEHYEIAIYGTLCSFAKTLDQDDALKQLKETLKEEKEVDNTLTNISESTINEKSMAIIGYD